MKKLVLLGAVSLLPGCIWFSSPDSAENTTPTPAFSPTPTATPSPTPTPACDPLAPPGAQGCSAGQKCTWIDVQENPEPLGELGCVADGTQALGAACTRGPAGLATGIDDCAAGGM